MKASNNSKHAIPDTVHSATLCEICGKTFKARKNLLKHVRCTHSNRSFECTDCGRKFNQKKILRNHVKIHLRNSTPNLAFHYTCYHCSKVFDTMEERTKHICLSQNENLMCVKCNKQFTRVSNLLRHRRTQHSEEMVDFSNTAYVPKVFECPICLRVFKRKDSLKRHIDIRHTHSASKTLYICNYCSREFSVKCTLISHINVCKVKFAEKTKFKCLYCGAAFYNEHLINQHYIRTHGVKFIYEDLEFQSFADFKKWRSNFEESTVTQFCSEHGWKTRTHFIKQYKCHRSGLRLAVPEENRKRFPKLSGSKKLNGICPAHIIVRENIDDKTCTVRFQKTHVGHNVGDESELWFKRLPEEEALRNQRKPKAGQSEEEFENKRKSRRRSSSKGELEKRQKRSRLQQDTTSAEYFASKYSREVIDGIVSDVDVHPEKILDNISNITVMSIFEGETPVSFDEVVENYRDSILFYKSDGQRDTVNGLEDSDVVLVYMDKFQADMLRRYCQECIAFDITYSQPKLHLHSMLIRDHEWEGIAVAFLLSTRADQLVVDIFLKTIERFIGTLSPVIIMSEMSMTYQNAWAEKMSQPEYSFFCSWYVNKQWEHHLNKIANKEKRKALSRRLYNMAQELNICRFEEELQSLLSETDPDFSEFIQYFESYCAYTSQFWAYCYRPTSGINTNMSLEGLHRIMKCELDQEKRIGSLAECLNALKEYTTIKEEQLERKKQRCQIYDFEKAAKLRRRHWQAERNGNISIHTVNSMTWSIHSNDSNGCVENYVVQKLNEANTCEICDGSRGLLRCSRCKICFHQFICTCLDCSMKCNMCKHIHALGLYLKEQTPVVSEKLEDQKMLAMDESVKFGYELKDEDVLTHAYVVEEVVLSDDNMDYAIEDIPVVSLETQKEQLLQEITSCVNGIQTKKSIEDLKKVWRKSIASVVEISENKSAQPLFTLDEIIIPDTEYDVKWNEGCS